MPQNCYVQVYRNQLWEVIYFEPFNVNGSVNVKGFLGLILLIKGFIKVSLKYKIVFMNSTS